MNMGIEPFLVATSVNLICAQRLVRRVCVNCKEELEVPQQALIDAGYTPEEAKTTKIYTARAVAHATSAATRAAPVFTRSWKLTMSSAS